MSSTGDCLGFGDLLMIDADSNVLWRAPSCNSDAGMRGPLVSSGNRHMAVYQDDHLSDPLIEVMRIESEDRNHVYREHAYFWVENSTRHIEELVWIDDARLTLKIPPEWGPGSNQEGVFSYWELRLPD